MDGFRHIDTWIFDLDDTLYEAEGKILGRIHARMTDFICSHLRVDAKTANALRQNYWQKYGTSLNGMMAEHGVDPERFLAEVHDVKISDVPPCPVTQQNLGRLPGRKIVFTNAPRGFAQNMLRHLGLDHHFHGMRALDDDRAYTPKPEPGAYRRVLETFSIDPARACMFEDKTANLKPAADLGMTTVWIRGARQKLADGDHPHVHHRHATLAEWLQSKLREKA